MTSTEKEHKIKLITLILIVEREKLRKQTFDHHWDYISFALEYVKWALELKNVIQTPVLKLE